MSRVDPRTMGLTPQARQAEAFGDLRTRLAVQERGGGGGGGVGGSVVDAAPGIKGKVALDGDLDGTASAPTIGAFKVTKGKMDKFAVGMYDLRDYGAVEGGDILAAWNAAHAAIVAERSSGTGGMTRGGVIFIPFNRCTTSGTLAITDDGISVQGLGSGYFSGVLSYDSVAATYANWNPVTEIKWAQGSAGTIMTLGPRVANWKLDGFALHGGSSNYATTGINFNRAQSGIIGKIGVFGLASGGCAYDFNTDGSSVFADNTMHISADYMFAYAPVGFRFRGEGAAGSSNACHININKVECLYGKNLAGTLDNTVGMEFDDSDNVIIGDYRAYAINDSTGYPVTFGAWARSNEIEHLQAGTSIATARVSVRSPAYAEHSNKVGFYDRENAQDAPLLQIPTAATTITSTTNATPIIVTTSGAHGLFPGDGVHVTGVSGAFGSYPANPIGHWEVGSSGYSSTTFELEGSTAPGATGSGGSVYRPAAQLDWEETGSRSVGHFIRNRGGAVSTVGAAANPGYHTHKIQGDTGAEMFAEATSVGGATASFEAWGRSDAGVHVRTYLRSATTPSQPGGRVGTGTNHPFLFVQNALEIFRLNASGHVQLVSGKRIGIGGDPAYPIDVRGASPEIRVYDTVSPTSATTGPALTLQAGAYPGAADHSVGKVYFGSWNGSVETTPVVIQGFSSEAWTGSALGSHLRFLTTTIGTTTPTERVRITDDGKVGIGATAPAASLTFATGTTAPGGIQFGTSTTNSVTMFRTANDELRIGTDANINSLALNCEGLGTTGFPASATVTAASTLYVGMCKGGFFDLCKTSGTVFRIWRPTSAGSALSDATTNGNPTREITAIGVDRWGPGGTTATDHALDRLSATYMRFNLGLQVVANLQMGGGCTLNMLANTGSTSAVVLATGDSKTYLRNDKFIIAYNDAGTVRYRYMLLTSANTTAAWTDSGTTEPT